MRQPFQEEPKHGGQIAFKVAPTRFVDYQDTPKAKHTRSFLGCRRCKEKKVKCDLHHPCLRCKRAKVECHWNAINLRPYKHAPGQTFNDVNIRSYELKSVVPAAPSTDIDDVSTRMFFNGSAFFGLVCGLTDIQGLTGVLQTLSAESTAFSSLRAFTTLAFAVEKRDSGLYQRSLQAKVAALKRLRLSLDMKQETSAVDVMASMIFMFCVSYTDPQGGRTNPCHLKAIRHVMHKITPEMISDPENDYILDMALTMVSWVNACQGVSSPLPQEMPAFDFESRPTSLCPSRRSLAWYTTRASHIRAESVALRFGGLEEMTLDELLERNERLRADAETLVAELKAANGSLGDPVTYHTGQYTINDADVETAQFWPGKLMLYASAEYCVRSLWFHITQVLPLHVAVHCCVTSLQYLPSSPSSETQRSVQSRLKGYYTDLQGIVDDISAMVPFSLAVPWGTLQAPLSHLRILEQDIPKDVKNGFTIPSIVMHFASRIEVVPERQRRWLKARNHEIAATHGLVYSRHYAELEGDGVLFGMGAAGANMLPGDAPLGPAAGAAVGKGPEAIFARLYDA